MKSATILTAEDVLTRSVGDLIDPDDSFKKKIQLKLEGKYPKDIIIKLGIDPTRPDIHLGFAVVLRKLRQFQDMGCKVVFIVGDFTARIGDPTGKSKTRPELEQAEIEKNLATYIEQVGKILRTDDTVFSWIRNSDWFTSITDMNLPDDTEVSLDVHLEGKTIKNKIEPNSIVGKAVVFEKTRMQVIKKLTQAPSFISLSGLLWTLKHITHSGLIERDMFQERIKKGEHLYMHEMLYPVLQGIDSHVIARIYGSCDLEIGGTDQHFNMLMGREVMKMNGQEPQAVMTLQILPGTDGKEKMSKSLDNYIAITDSPNDMFGKVMSIPDSVIVEYLKLATYIPLADIEETEKKLEKGKENPRDIKAALAHAIVETYHGRELANQAEENFEKVFKKGGVPEEMSEIPSTGKEKLSDLLTLAKIVESKSEFRRLLESGAIEQVGGQKIMDTEFVPTGQMEIKVGKRRFVRIVLK
jgi:tyrosyl-tRNA synthetase